MQSSWSLLLLAFSLYGAGVAGQCTTESLVARGFGVNEFHKLVLLGGSHLHITYEDRDDFELSIAISGATVKESGLNPSLTKFDVRAAEGAECSTELFCGEGLACSNGFCTPSPYNQCDEQTCDSSPCELTDLPATPLASTEEKRICPDFTELSPDETECICRGPSHFVVLEDHQSCGCANDQRLAKDGRTCYCPNNKLHDTAAEDCYCPNNMVETPDVCTCTPPMLIEQTADGEKCVCPNNMIIKPSGECGCNSQDTGNPNIPIIVDPVNGDSCIEWVISSS
eukprot:2212738-Rhodomonas_salina.3